MQFIKSTVDTRSNNGVIGSVNMYDELIALMDARELVTEEEK